MYRSPAPATARDADVAKRKAFPALIPARELSVARESEKTVIVYLLVISLLTLRHRLNLVLYHDLLLKSHPTRPLLVVRVRIRRVSGYDSS